MAVGVRVLVGVVATAIVALIVAIYMYINIRKKYLNAQREINMLRPYTGPAPPSALPSSTAEDSGVDEPSEGDEPEDEPSEDEPSASEGDEPSEADEPEASEEEEDDEEDEDEDDDDEEEDDAAEAANAGADESFTPIERPAAAQRKYKRKRGGAQA